MLKTIENSLHKHWITYDNQCVTEVSVSRMLRFTTERGFYTARTLIVASSCPHYTPFPMLVLFRTHRHNSVSATFRPRMLFLTMPYCRTNRQHRLGLLRPCTRFSPFGSRKCDGSISEPRRFSDSARRHCFCLSRSKSKPWTALILPLIGIFPVLTIPKCSDKMKADFYM